MCELLGIKSTLKQRVEGFEKLSLDCGVISHLYYLVLMTSVHLVFFFILIDHYLPITHGKNSPILKKRKKDKMVP